MTHEELYESKSQMKRIEILKAEEKQMSRDELLAKINDIRTNYLPETTSELAWERLADATRALRAVVELPIEDNSKPDSFNMNFANRSPNEIAAQCFQWGYATAMNKVIQAIEKELK